MDSQQNPLFLPGEPGCPAVSFSYLAERDAIEAATPDSRAISRDQSPFGEIEPNGDGGGGAPKSKKSG